MSDYESIDDVVVVGGGDVGLLNALMIERFNDSVDITVVDDFSEDVPQIGKSTYSKIRPLLHDTLGIDRERFFKEVRPVWKCSVNFQRWVGYEPFHVAFDETRLPVNDDVSTEEFQHRYDTGNFRTLGAELAEQERTPFHTEGGEYSDGELPDYYPKVAYHLDTQRFNPFLRTLCGERGIDLVDDKVTNVEVEANEIVTVESDSETYDGDLYIDATGFKRVLMGELEADYTSFDCPLDSAVVAQAPLDHEDIEPSTVIRSYDYGWCWQIDTYSVRDLGYVYSSSHVSDEEATEEFLERTGEGLTDDDVTTYRFDSGMYEDAWVNNCVVVGNGFGFVEPLQSTALTTHAFVAERLGKMLADHDQMNSVGLRELYNEITTLIWEDIRNFISIHYRHVSGDTDFWDEIGEDMGPDSIPQHRRYVDTGFASHQEAETLSSEFPLFGYLTYALVLYYLGEESEFHEQAGVEAGLEAVESVEAYESAIDSRIDASIGYEEVYDIVDDLNAD